MIQVTLERRRDEADAAQLRALPVSLWLPGDDPANGLGDVGQQLLFQESLLGNVSLIHSIVLRSSAISPAKIGPLASPHGAAAVKVWQIRHRPHGSTYRKYTGIYARRPTIPRLPVAVKPPASGIIPQTGTAAARIVTDPIVISKMPESPDAADPLEPADSASPLGPPGVSSNAAPPAAGDDADPTAGDAPAAGAGTGWAHAAAKVRTFPQTPGVYLMKDAAGLVIYVGKAVNLRSRAGSYFLKAAAEEHRTADLVREIADIDYLEADSEVDALLIESRLIKDVQPKFNRDLKDDKTFPYLEVFVREDFPRVEFTREPQDRGTKLYGPFASAGSLRGAIQVLQKIFKFRTCSLDIDEGDEKWRWFRPCLLHSIGQCTAPCNMRISKEEYRRDIARLRMFLEGNKKRLLKEMRAEMTAAAAELKFEKAARLRDEIHALETLDRRGELDTHVQPEVFFIDPKKGLAGLKKVLQLEKRRARSRGWTSPIWAVAKPWRAWCNSSMDCRSSRATSDTRFAAWPGSTTLPASTRLSPGGSSGSRTKGKSSPICC